MASQASPVVDNSGIQYCVVCGMGSHRKDWIKKAAVGGKVYVACDSHSQSDVQAAAVAAATPPKP